MGDQRGATSVLDAIVHTMDDNTSRKVYGEPVRVGEVTVIPAAKISGRGGGGGGVGPAVTIAEGEETTATTGRRQPPGTEGAGGGLTQSAIPVGAYIVKGNRVTWRPAIDVNRLILGGQAVAIVALLTVRAIFKRRQFVVSNRRR